MPRVRESPARGSARPKHTGTNPKSPGRAEKRAPPDSTLNETTDDSFVSALKQQQQRKPPKRLFGRNSPFQPEIPSAILETPPAASGSEASPPSDASFLCKKVIGGRRRVFRRRSRFRPEIPSSILFEGAPEGVCTSTPFKRAAGAGGDEVINVSCIAVPAAGDAAKEVAGSPVKLQGGLRKSVESDDGSIFSSSVIKSPENSRASKGSTPKSPFKSSTRGAVISEIIDRLNKSNNNADQSVDDKAPSPEKLQTPPANCSEHSRNVESLHKSLDVANVTFRDGRKKQNSRLLQLSPKENEAPPVVHEEERENETEPAQKQSRPSSSCSQRSRKRSLEECLEKTPTVARDSRKNSRLLLQMSPQESETQTNTPQQQQQQNENNPVTVQQQQAPPEAAETTPKRRKISVTAQVHAATTTVSEENHVICAQHVENLLPPPRNFVPAPQKRGFSCADCNLMAAVTLVDVDTSTADLGSCGGVTIKCKCVTCSRTKLLVEVATSTADLEAATAAVREMGTSTTDFNEIPVTTEEASTSTTDLHPGKTTKSVQVAPETRAKSVMVAPSGGGGGELNESAAVASCDRHRSLRNSSKPVMSAARADISIRSSSGNFEIAAAAPSVAELNQVAALGRRKSLRNRSKHRVTAEELSAFNEDLFGSRGNVEAAAPSGGGGELNKTHQSLRRSFVNVANASAREENPLRSSVNCETAPSGGELKRVSAAERRKSLRDSSAKAVKLRAGQENLPGNSSVSFQAAPSGGGDWNVSFDRRKSPRRSSKRRSKSATNANKSAVGGGGEEIPVEAAPSAVELHEVSFSELVKSLRSSSKQRLSARNSTLLESNLQRSDTNTAAPSVVAAENTASTARMRTDSESLVDLRSNVEVTQKKKRPTKAKKQTESKESVAVRRSERARKPAAVPLNIVVSTNTRFVHGVNKFDYYKHENTDKESIRKFLSPFMHVALASELKTPRKSRKTNVASETTTATPDVRKSTKGGKSARKTQNGRAKSSLAPRKTPQTSIGSSSETTVADVSAGSEGRFCAPVARFKRVKDAEDLAVAVGISDRANARVMSGFLEISAGGKKLESSTRNQISYAVFEGQAEVCIDGKQFRAKAFQEFMVRKGEAYSITNVSKQRKLTLRFVKVYA